MKVVVRNSNPVNAPEWKKVYKCDVCGSEKFWSDDHSHIERFEHWWDIYFIACSEECRLNSRTPFIKWLSDKIGWNVKKATENFDNCVLPNRIKNGPHEGKQEET